MFVASDTSCVEVLSLFQSGFNAARFGLSYAVPGGPLPMRESSSHIVQVILVQFVRGSLAGGASVLGPLPVMLLDVAIRERKIARSTVAVAGIRPPNLDDLIPKPKRAVRCIVFVMLDKYLSPCGPWLDQLRILPHFKCWTAIRD